MKDVQIEQMIEKEAQRQLLNIELIASENYVSDDVLQAAGSILTNKYAEGYPSKRYYGGCFVVDEIEELARERAKKLFGADALTLSRISRATVPRSCLARSMPMCSRTAAHRRTWPYT